MSTPAAEGARSLSALGHAVWGDEVITLSEQVTKLAVTLGDLAREARAEEEGGQPDVANVRRELANLMLTSARFLRHWGDIAGSLRLAEEAQRNYVKRRYDSMAKHTGDKADQDEGTFSGDLNDSQDKKN